MTDQDINIDPEKNPLKGDDKDLQRIASWLGRVEADTKKQREAYDNLASKIEELSSSKKKPEFGDDDQAKFNEKLHEMILDGRVMEAVSIINDVQKQAKDQLKAADRKKFDTAIQAVADDPIMKDKTLSEQVKQRAAELMNDNLPATAAVNMAKMEAENNFLRNAGGGAKSLELLGSGGHRPPPAGEKKLPDLAEQAYQKAKDLFKDRQEYIDNLDPRVREQWGLNA